MIKKFFFINQSKLISTFVSFFTSNYVFYWKEFFPNKILQYPPSFDARAICYPSIQNIKDYLSWRQADCKKRNLIIKYLYY